MKLRTAFVFLAALWMTGCGGPIDGFDDTESGDTTLSDSSFADVSSATDTATSHDTGTVQNELRLYKSGTRIKAKVLTTDDGAQAFMGWYDTVLEVDCSMSSYMLAEEGKARCIPTKTLVYDQGHYSDPACTKRLYQTHRLKADCTPLEVGWITLPSSTCGNTTYSIYRDGHVYDGDVVYYKSGDTCLDMTTSYNQNHFLDSLGTKQSPETFAEASIALVE